MRLLRLGAQLGDQVSHRVGAFAERGGQLLLLFWIHGGQLSQQPSEFIVDHGVHVRGLLLRLGKQVQGRKHVLSQLRRATKRPQEIGPKLK